MTTDADTAVRMPTLAIYLRNCKARRREDDHILHAASRGVGEHNREVVTASKGHPITDRRARDGGVPLPLPLVQVPGAAWRGHELMDAVVGAAIPEHPMRNVWPGRWK